MKRNNTISALLLNDVKTTSQIIIINYREIIISAIAVAVGAEREGIGKHFYRI